MPTAISVFSPLLPIILFLLFCFRKSSKELWVIFFYSILALSIDYLQSRTSWGLQVRLKIFAISDMVEYLLFSTFFYLAINSKIVKKLIIILLIPVLFFLILRFFRADKNYFDAISSSVESILIIIFSIIYFFEQINKPTQHIIYSSPNFWVVLAFLIYMSGTLFLFIISNNLPTEKMAKYWVINNILNVITNLMFSIAFLVSRFVNQNPSPENPYDDALERL